jgi:hypothetical protein
MGFSPGQKAQFANALGGCLLPHDRWEFLRAELQNALDSAAACPVREDARSNA